MSASEVAIVVRYQAMEGKGDEVAALLARHTAATRAEPGNLDFVALRSTEDPDAFVLAGLPGVIRVPCPGEELPASSDGDTVRVSCRDAADRVTATGQIS